MRRLQQGGVTELAAAERKLKRPNARSRVPLIGSRSSEEVRGQDTASEKDAELLSKMAAWAEQAERSESSDGKVDSQKPQTASVDANDDGGEEMEIDNEGDYVYDTYVRHLVAADTELEVVGEGAVGHLIISEDDQDLWDAYIEDEDGSEKEFDTDSEDSNGSFHVFIPPTLSTSINHILTTHPTQRKIIMVPTIPKTKSQRTTNTTEAPTKNTVSTPLMTNNGATDSTRTTKTESLALETRRANFGLVKCSREQSGEAKPTRPVPRCKLRLMVVKK